MKIKAIELRKDGFMTEGFAFGGEEGYLSFDNKRRYRSSLQNYLIDTGDEVILIDTGFPKSTPVTIPDNNTMIYPGYYVGEYVEQLEKLGYRKSDVTKIILTHKHLDHSGCLKDFPNAKIYVSEEESMSEELKDLENLVIVKFLSGPYKNFPQSEKICDNIYMIRAKGHTNGNSLVILEDKDLYYMFQGDITYTDEALYLNKLSIVFEDIVEARITLDRVREFVSNNKTIYLSTHTPLGIENLENKKIIDLDNMLDPIPVKDVVVKKASGKYICQICGFVYDPMEGMLEKGIAKGTPFEALPDDFKCPKCGADKSKFSRG